MKISIESLFLKCKGREFHKIDAALSNRLFPYLTVLVDGTTRRFDDSERRLREGVYGTMSSLMYIGACPWSAQES